MTAAYSFPVPLYSGRVLICVTRDAYNRAHKKYLGSEDKHLSGVFGTSRRGSDKDKNSVYLVGVFEGGDTTLVHELVHVTFSILSHSGVPISVKHDEAFAYLMDSLYTAAMPAVQRLRKKRK